MNTKSKGKGALCHQDIRDIRKSVEELAVIADQYSITELLVYEIRSRKVWGYVP
jgi:hypothetical protein